MKFLRVLVVALCFAPLALAQTNSPALQLLEQALRFVDTQYFGSSELNIQALGEKYRAQLVVVCTPFGDACGFDKAESLIATMLAELADNHAYYLSAAAVQSRNATQSGVNNSPAPILGFSHLAMLDAAKKLRSYDRLITNVLPGSPADVGGLRYGDRWIGFDNTLFSSLTGDDEYNLTLQNFTARVRSTEPFTLLVIRDTERQRLELKMQGKIFNQAQLPSLTVRPDNVAVLRIRTFLVSGVGQQVHRLLGSLANTTVNRLILDMRGNGGGLANERWFTAGAFIQDPEPQRRVPRPGSQATGFEESYSLGRFFIKSLAGEELQSQRLEFFTRFDGAVVLLVDGGCASACEFLSSSFRRAKRATIIGEPTVGIGNTNTQGFALQNGGAVSLPTLRSYWTDNTWLPAKIVPDILTPQFELELFSTGRDLPIEQALETLKQSQ
jgi:carboxyl-terminal processing protease